MAINKLLTSINGKTSGQASRTINNEDGRGAFSVATGPDGTSISGNFQQLLQKRKVESKTRSPIKELYRPNGGKVYKPIVFPTDLDNDHYIVFNVVERNRPSRKELGTKRIIRSVVLPIPAELSVEYGVDYTTDNLGVFGGSAAGLVGGADIKNGVAGLGELIGKKVSAATDAFKNRDTDAAVKALAVAAPAVAAGAGAAGFGALAGIFLAGASAPDIISGTSVSEGIAINPHMAVLFKGVNLKEHAFSYRLIARNEKESRLIKNIIRVFKYHMHPSYLSQSNLAFEYPDEFEIEFAQSIADNMYKVGTSVLKSFTVNYNGESTPLFFEDTGAPVVIDLQMSFQETKIMTKDDMDDPNLDTANEFGEYM